MEKRLFISGTPPRLFAGFSAAVRRFTADRTPRKLIDSLLLFCVAWVPFGVLVSSWDGALDPHALPEALGLTALLGITTSIALASARSTRTRQGVLTVANVVIGASVLLFLSYRGGDVRWLFPLGVPCVLLPATLRMPEAHTRQLVFATLLLFGAVIVGHWWTAHDDGVLRSEALEWIGLAATSLALIRVASQGARLQTALRRANETTQTTLRAIADAVITTDADGNVTYLNPVAEMLIDWAASDAEGEPLAKVLLLSGSDEAEPFAPDWIARLLEGGAPAPIEFAKLLSRTGQSYSVEFSAAPVIAVDGACTGLVVVFRDVTETRAMVEQIAHDAQHDNLTGLKNRRAFEQEAESLLRDAAESGQQHAMLFIDLDRFKIVNDTGGHQAGDLLLRQLAGTLRSLMRKADTVARIGGDEFGLLLRSCPLDEAERIAHGVLRGVEEYRLMWEDRVYRVGASIGVVSIDGEEHSLSRLLAAADLASYQAKQAGGGRVEVFRPGGEELSRRKREMDWASRIVHYLEEGRVTLMYQRLEPLSRDVSDQPMSEVLLRLKDDDGTLIPPTVFMPAAERFGLMQALDRATVAALCLRLGREGERLGAEERAALPVYAVNVSAASINDPTFLDELLKRLTAHSVSASRVCFDISESVAVLHMERAVAFAAAVRALGCKIALDDFGSGLSSFAYLRQMTLDYVKIDGSRIRGMMADQVDRVVIEAIQRVGELLNVRTIAEFVEDTGTLERLRSMGIDYAQGYIVHRPEILDDGLSGAARHPAVGARHSLGSEASVGDGI
jgi:diguanylate cyclase (GGDEF)-like protein/PAS domain S-box-containing protein